MKDLGADAWMNVITSMLAAAACAGFAVTYHLQAPWWKSDVGRNQMGFAAVIGALCVYTVLATVLQDNGCALVVLRSIRTLVLLSVAWLMVQRTRLMLKAQREYRNRSGV
ncbi:hypothetical protein AB0N99_31015 [Streptomyces sp. NPDC093272]|uniref:putative phage holin n=1 Tax=Streptomyces sp. NPDC093272 TaxID=3154981 RepID=UPI00344317D5